MIGVDSEKIDQYIEIAAGVGSTAEVATIEDPFTRSVTLLFMLVKEHGLDPWSLDLKHTIQEYQKYAVKEDDLDLPLAGSVLGWAWDVLRLRATGAIEATEPIPEPQPEWVDFDFGWEPTYAEQLEDSSEPPIEESVLNKEDLEDFLIQNSGKLIKKSLSIVDNVNDYISSAPENRDVAALAELIKASSSAIETLNKLHVAKERNETQLEVKKIDVESKERINIADNQAKILLSREDIMKALVEDESEVIDV